MSGAGVAMYKEAEKTLPVINVENYAHLVKRIAHHMMVRMPASVQVEDLIQAGMVGLLEAAQKFDASKGASFETYAGIRVRGAIVDEMRRGDWVPRSVHRNSRRVADAVARVEARNGRDASDEEIAREMGVELDEYHQMLLDSTSSRLFSYDEACEEDDGTDAQVVKERQLDNPLNDFQRDNMLKALSQEILKLPERERLVMALYYDEELNLKEIGAVIGVSESRVSQIHTQAALRLKGRLADWR